jgi:hypothetical protein
MTIFVVTFRALRDPDGIPAAVRLRATLRTALRRDRLRCEAVEEVRGERPEETNPEPKKKGAKG